MAILHSFPSPQHVSPLPSSSSSIPLKSTLSQFLVYDAILLTVFLELPLRCLDLPKITASLHPLTYISLLSPPLPVMPFEALYCDS